MKLLNMTFNQKYIICLISLLTIMTPYYSYSGEQINTVIKVVKPMIKKSKTSSAKVIGGSSVILSNRIGTPQGYSAHHIIPVELRTHRVLEKIGMDLDEAKNGISLPQYPGIDPILPLHRGSHPDYTIAVKKALDDIPETLSVVEKKNKIIEVQNHFRKLLESGKPLHSSQGGYW